MKNFATLMFVLAAAAGCKKKAEEQKKPPEPPPSDAAIAVDAAPAAWDGTSPLTLSEGFQTPESVLYDADSDVYLVSNINGKPTDADDNGYISRVSPEGKVTEPTWIDGSKENVKLDAPKGMAITNGTLYVSDITVVRMFDAKTGEPKGEVKVDGAVFLNDIAVAPDGGIVVTDTSLSPEFKGTGKDAIYHIGKDGKVKPLIKNKALQGPNGITPAEGGGYWVATFGSNELYMVDAKGKQGKPEKLPKGQLDGIVVLDGGEVLVSSWEGQAIYRGKPGAEWKPVVENQQSPADIGWDAKRKRILIPVFMGNSIILHPLP